MWKCASGSLRATFRKSVSRCNTVFLTKVQQDKEFKCFLKIAPVLIEHCNRYYGFYKNTCGNYSKDRKDKEGPKKRNSFLENFDNNVFDALRWSGVFVIGYYFLQPFAQKRISSSNFNCYENHLYPTLNGYQKTFQYLIEAVGIKPYNCVLPEAKAANQKSTGAFKNFKYEKENFSGLEKAHQKVLGTLNNWMGTHCMHTGKHKEALKYFSQAAEEQNAAGIFNLGICHERGLGTSQNFSRAAELYQKAADLGHPTAMYNLGVFYAQGLGGVEADFNHAKELFEAAASLGQRDAVKALYLNNQSIEKSLKQSLCNENILNTNESEMFESSLDCEDRLGKRLENREVCNYAIQSANCCSFDCSGKNDNSLSLNSDSGVLVLDLYSPGQPEVVPV